MPHTLTAINISKTIRRKAVLSEVNLGLQGGKVYGFVGENGSGKTMLFRVLSGLVKPTTGEVLYNGNALGKRGKDVRVGVIIENTSLWPDLTAYENLCFLASLKHYIGPQQVKEALQRVGLDEKNSLPIKNYSLGMRQRLIVAQAIMEKPDFLFLDEPTNSIDAEGTKVVREIIEQEAGRGAVVLLASHISQDISELCESTFVMRSGHCTPYVRTDET